MEWLVANWYIVMAIVAILVAVIVYIIQYVNKPMSVKINNFKQWLRYAVSEAERQLGGGTGQLKLRFVYNMAVEKFPWIVSVIPFETFSKWVDDALIWMQEQLSVNPNISRLVNGEEANNGSN